MVNVKLVDVRLTEFRRGHTLAVVEEVRSGHIFCLASKDFSQILQHFGKLFCGDVGHGGKGRMPNV